jgi:hypothetical protein
MSAAAAMRIGIVTGAAYPLPSVGERSGESRLGYQAHVTSSDREAVGTLVDTMKRASAALRAADVEFMLGGGLAVWARGGPPTGNDVDFFVREEDAEPALDGLAAAGFVVEKPPEEWLYKAYDGETLVDLIFRPAGGAVADEHFGRASWMEVLAQPVLVASIDDVLTTKLLALTEQEPDYQAVLAVARALREQIDWDFVESRTAGSPFACAFFTLVEGLGIVERSSALAAADA